MGRASRWGSRIRRLTSMGRAEVLDRSRQYWMARADAVRYRMGRDVASGFEAEAGRLGRFFFLPKDVPALCSVLQRSFPDQAREIVLRGERICHHRFDLLGYEELDYGADIDWHCDIVHGKRSPQKPWFKIRYLDFDEVGDAKITWELNRHQHFVTLAQAYGITGDEKFTREILAQWKSWHKQNRYPMGINWASSLEVALRSLSWTWTYFLLADSGLLTEDLRREWLHALQVSGRHIETYLSTYFSPNTHLLGEALGLFVLGTAFPTLPSASRWRERGWAIVVREAGRQVRGDGFYVEQSVYYHVYALDLFLHARILAAKNAMEIPAEFDDRLQRMLSALRLLGRTGVPATFGDDDGGRLFDPRRNQAEHLLDPLATGAVVYKRGDLKSVVQEANIETLWLLGAEGLSQFESLPSVKPSDDSDALRDAGLYLMFDPPQKQLLIDAGGLGFGSGGHGHADALSVCLFQGKETLLTDSGTFEYISTTAERAVLRGTAAHNTLQVDGLDQTETDGPFAWASHPQVKAEQWIPGKRFDLFEGSHGGYARLAQPVIHRRFVFHRKGKFWLVLDRAEGRGRHQLDIRWHLGPRLAPISSEPLAFAGEGDGPAVERPTLAVLAPQGHGWSESVGKGDFSPVYGKKGSTTVVTFRAAAELPAEFVTLLFAGVSAGAAVPRGRFLRVNEQNEKVSAYRYSEGVLEHEFFFANQPGSWAEGLWASDAQFLYSCCDRETNQHMLVFCAGSYAEAGGQRVLSCVRRLRYAEIVGAPGQVDVQSSDPSEIRVYKRPDRIFETLDSGLLSSNSKRVK